MNRKKYILRGTLLFLIVLLLINLYRKTDDNLSRIAKFKLETFNKIQTDSLDAEHKLDYLVKETRKFNKQLDEDSPQIRVAVRYVLIVVGLLIAAEVWFLITKDRRPAG